MNELACCPCCGHVSPEAIFTGELQGYFVRCPGCGLRTAICPTEAEAKERWNRRDHSGDEAAQLFLSDLAADQFRALVQLIRNRGPRQGNGEFTAAGIPVWVNAFRVTGLPDPCTPSFLEAALEDKEEERP